MGSWKTVAKHVGVIVLVVAACAWAARSTTVGKKVFSTSAT